MYRTVLAVILFSFCSLCRGQNDSIVECNAARYNISLSYISTLIYPGATGGIEFPLQHINQHSTKNIKYFKRRFISGNLNWYHHPGFHDNIYITAEWVMRRTRYSGFISEFSAGTGFSRTFLGGTTYRVDNGTISVVQLAGYNYAMITVGGGFGYDFSEQKKMPFSAIAKLNIISMFPYNSTIYFRPVLTVGFRYSLIKPLRNSLKDTGNNSPR
jgi:hypothetical protein